MHTKYYLFCPLVPPTLPVLGPIREVEACTNCIVVQEGLLPDVQCKSTGTLTLILLKIGNRRSCIIEKDADGIHSNFPSGSLCTMLASDHGARMSCLVYNQAVPDGLSSEPKTLFVTGTRLKVIKVFAK